MPLLTDSLKHRKAQAKQFAPGAEKMRKEMLTLAHGLDSPLRHAQSRRLDEWIERKVQWMSEAHSDVTSRQSARS
jgi:hypothetical protein